eukprot:Trichotokara_eunicae@DN5763_c0_g1_i1.p1
MSDRFRSVSMSQNRYGQTSQRATLFSTFGRERNVVLDDEESSIGVGGEKTVEIMERENDEKILELDQKVSTLAQISRGLKTQVEESNTLLNQMSTRFDNVRSLVSQSVGRIKQIGSWAGSRHVCMLMLFFVAFIFLLVVMSKRSLIRG